MTPHQFRTPIQLTYGSLPLPNSPHIVYLSQLSCTTLRRVTQSLGTQFGSSPRQPLPSLLAVLPSWGSHYHSNPPQSRCNGPSPHLPPTAKGRSCDGVLSALSASGPSPHPPTAAKGRRSTPSPLDFVRQCLPSWTKGPRYRRPPPSSRPRGGPAGDHLPTARRRRSQPADTSSAAHHTGSGERNRDPCPLPSTCGNACRRRTKESRRRQQPPTLAPHARGHQGAMAALATATRRPGQQRSAHRLPIPPAAAVSIAHRKGAGGGDSEPPWRHAICPPWPIRERRRYRCRRLCTAFTATVTATQVTVGGGNQQSRGKAK